MSLYLRLVIATSMALACLANSFAAEPAAEDATAEVRPKITLGKETTYITEPLRPDGYPDYIAALNQRMSQGVTVENNAAVLLAKAFGPGILDDGTRDETYKLLGIEPLPKEGDYLISQEDFAVRWKSKRPVDAPPISDEEIEEQFEAASERPWTRNEFPIVAAWIDANQIPLRLAIEATQRPRYFWPYVMLKDEIVPTIISVLLEHVRQSHEVATLLASRAMLRIAAKDFEGAWQDILTCHRLASKIGAGYTLVESLQASAIETIAANTAISYAHYGALPSAQAKSCQAAIRRLPPPCDVARSVELGERFMFLDNISHFAREGRFGPVKDLIDLIVALTGKKREAPQKRSDDPILLDPDIDWNVPMRLGNEWYDRLVAAARIAEPRARAIAVQQFDDDLKKMINAIANRRGMVREFVDDKKTNKRPDSARFGQMMLSLLLPALAASTVAEERVKLYREMEHIAFALAAYRADHGGYPDNLKSLVPKYVDSLPDDTFRKRPGPICYRRDGDAYMFWTVYRNGKDDNGVGFDGRVPASKGGGDDFVLRPVQRVK